MDLLQPIDDIHYCNSICVVIIACLSVICFFGVKCRTCLIELLMGVRKILVGRAPLPVMKDLKATAAAPRFISS